MTGIGVAVGGRDFGKVRLFVAVLFLALVALPLFASEDEFGTDTCGGQANDLKWNDRFMLVTTLASLAITMALVLYHEKLESRVKYALLAVATLVFFLPFLHALYVSNFDFDAAFISGQTHEHAYVFVLVNGTEYDMWKLWELQNRTKNLSENEAVHMHDGIGNIVHKHAYGVTWSYFFRSIGLSLDDNCVTLDRGYCSSGGETLQFFTSGTDRPAFGRALRVGSQEIQPEALIIYYGPEEQDADIVASKVQNLSSRMEQMNEYLESSSNEC